MTKEKIEEQLDGMRRSLNGINSNIDQINWYLNERNNQEKILEAVENIKYLYHEEKEKLQKNYEFYSEIYSEKFEKIKDWLEDNTVTPDLILKYIESVINNVDNIYTEAIRICFLLKIFLIGFIILGVIAIMH